MLSIICLIVFKISIVQSSVNCGTHRARDCSSCHHGKSFFKTKISCHGDCYWGKKTCGLFFKWQCPDCLRRPVVHKPVVHGGIGHWSSWTVCSSNCQSKRTRNCDNPVPKNGGKQCTGISRHESKICKGGNCKSKINNILILFTQWP